jgi:hypothetical protein
MSHVTQQCSMCPDARPTWRLHEHLQLPDW